MVAPQDAGLAVLELKGIGKEFGAIRALHGVDLRVSPGEVVGLMGNNGAGKSTLVKIIAGNFPPSHGEIRLDGKAVHFARPIDARSRRCDEGQRRGDAELDAQAARAERHGSGPVLAADRHRYPAERISAAIFNGAAIAFDER